MEGDLVRRVCYDQIKAIIDYMGQHVNFAMGVQHTTEGRHHSKKLWGELAMIVNGVRGGTKKTPHLWSRYWSDFKNKLKNKVRFMNRMKRTEATSGKQMKPLTKLEKRALVILGPKFAKIKYRKGDHSTNDSYSKHLPAEVKVESCQESSNFCKETSDTSDRLSDGERDETEESSPEENGEDMEQSFSEPALQNIYPKWLIDVEKKRADAELTRARAEESRVAVAAKNAEASLIQAEALKRLAEAANMQAEAIMRIAMVLEHGQNSQLLPI